MKINIKPGNFSIITNNFSTIPPSNYDSSQIRYSAAESLQRTPQQVSQKEAEFRSRIYGLRFN